MSIEGGRPLPLVAHQVFKSFQDGDRITEVLKGVDLELQPGEFVALIGPSGSGKSTLLSILGTLLQMTSGRVEIAGRDTGGLSPRELDRFRNRHLGFVFQFHHLLPDFTATENVLMPWAARQDGAAAEALRRAQVLLDRVGLGDRMDYRVTQLSGGQKQRVAIARAILMNPTVVLCDEPTGNLDRETSSAVLELLREIGRDEDTAFLISTHDPEVAASCDRVIKMVDGRIEEEVLA